MMIAMRVAREVLLAVGKTRPCVVSASNSRGHVGWRQKSGGGLYSYCGTNLCWLSSLAAAVAQRSTDRSQVLEEERPFSTGTPTLRIR